jgi:hypothetical protein
MRISQACMPFAAAYCLLLGACDFEHVATGPLRDEPVSIEGGKAERANVELDMGAGEMTVRGGGAKLLEGRFEYNVEAWKPIVKSSIGGSHATLTIQQPSHVHAIGNQRYVWDLQLNDRILLDLAINCGAGQARLNLGSLDMRNVEVHMGAGQVDLDLRGKPTRDYEVKINGGVGQANIRLPAGVGIWAQAHGGIGQIEVTGLQKEGDHWANDLYEKAKVNLKIEVNGGIGEIRIIG